MTICFHPINPAVQSFPKPSLPVQPIFEISGIRWLPNKTGAAISAFIDQGEFFVNARTALAYALKLSGVDASSGVLLPAYHCGSMIEPALWLNAEVLLYQLTPGLAPLQSHLEQLLQNSQKPVRVLVLPHYFGFPQRVEYWRDFCDQHQLALIEDCSHAFFGAYQNQPLGSFGDYAIASVRKFFSCPDGGVLIGKLATHKKTTRRAKMSQQVHAVLRHMLQSAEAGGLGMLGLCINWLEQWRGKRKQHPPLVSTTASEKTQSWQWFNPQLIESEGLPISKFLMRHSHLQSMIAIRRRNYDRLLKGLALNPSLTPLFPSLPEQVVPYMFPVLLTSGEADFVKLKSAGVPIWRWEELAASDCSVSQRYRTQLLHIPCHQNLKIADIEWIIRQFDNILNKQSL